MPIATQEAIIEAIKAIGNITVRRYYGELSDPTKPLIKDNELPLILVDYTGDEPNASEVAINFNIYTIHITQSSNIINRQIKHEEVLQLLKSIDRALALSLNGEAIVKLGRGRKIFDAVSTKGYMTIWMRQLIATKQTAYQLDSNSNL